MLWWGKKKPQSDAEMLLESLAGVKKHQGKMAKAHKRKWQKGWLKYADPRILTALGIILLAVLVDGVRRENQEFAATIVNVTGQVSVADTDTTAPRWAKVKDQLLDGNVVRTVEKSSTTLSWPDGSLLVVGPESQMTIKLLEYSRAGAWRGRSFYVKLGQVWAKVAPGFGHQSEMKIYTPTSVAAVRGTVFTVSQNRQGTESSIACAQGTVRTAGLIGSPVDLPSGEQTVIAKGEAPRRPVQYSLDEQRALGFGYGALWTPPPNAGKLQTVEYFLTQLLSAPMTILGIGKCGWAFGAIDSARRTSTLEALRRLRMHLEGSPEYPPTVDCATLQELSLDPKERDQIINNLNNYALDRYYALEGGRSFVLYARARDKARTMYKVSPVGVERATPEEEKQIL